MISGTRHMRQLPARVERAWALDPEDLEAAIQADLDAGLIPFYLVATFGTTSSCAVDPLRPLGELAARHGLWCAARAVRNRAACGFSTRQRVDCISWPCSCLSDRFSVMPNLHSLVWLAEAVQPPAVLYGHDARCC